MISSMLNRFTRKATVHPDARSHTFEPRTLNTKKLFNPNTLLTTKKWVVTKGQVGILNEFTGPATCMVHLVNDLGETVQHIEVGINDVQIARLEDIPEKRRPDIAHGARLGYY